MALTARSPATRRPRPAATAASLWNTGAMGASVAFDRYEIAVLLSVVNFAALRWLGRFKDESSAS